MAGPRAHDLAALFPRGIDGRGGSRTVPATFDAVPTSGVPVPVSGVAAARSAPLPGPTIAERHASIARTVSNLAAGEVALRVDLGGAS